jgi:crotonobetainyl-CoA:carnitine CoA-transferase CaiB-like acyl-CoA transferase
MRFANNRARCQNRSELDVIISDVLKNLTADELKERLVRGQIAFGAVNSVRELSAHPQLRRIAVKTPSGPVDMPAPPVVERGEIRSLRPVPALGMHSERIRREFADEPAEAGN